MREIDPGHRYVVQTYPAVETDGPQDKTITCLTFRKRIGPRYPGNEGEPYDGTTTQELLRVIIARSRYVNNQEPHNANTHLIRSARMSILELEQRATARRGAAYLQRWEEDLRDWLYDRNDIEVALPCAVCGHIFCRRHER